MLEPRQADIPVLFLVLVVFPVVAYVLLGKWGEASKRKERINFLAQQAAEESFRAEAMSTPSVIPMASSSGYIPVLSPTIPSVIPVASSQGFVPSQTTFRQCANCHAPSTTRCARCKSVRYCSGKCQIIHWRQGHKEECMPPESNSSSYKCASTEEAHDNRAFNDKDKSAQLQERAPFDVRTPVTNVDASSNTVPVAVDTSRIPKVDRKSAEKRRSRKPTRDSIGREDKSARVSSDGTLGNRDSCSSFSSFNPSKQDSTRPKLRGGCSADPEGGVSESRDMSNPVPSHGHTASRSKVHPNAGFECQSGGLAENGKGGVRHSRDYSAENGDGLKERLSSNEVSEMCSGTVPSNVNVRAKSASHLESTEVPKLPKSRSKASREQAHFGKDRNGHTFDDSIASNGNFIPAQGHDGVTSNKFMKIMGFKKSPKTTREDSSVGGDNYNRVKVLFPYEEFVKFFQCKVYGLVPRGLMNCGNSCYANAVLQCLTCTKPLVMYLLSRTHSRSCCGKNWCLMCELEQHVLMLRETGGPLSPSRILSHMRSINCQIGDGSQEDAHEFLRLLIASMQSICLEEVGGENQVHPSLQETTFVQHTFGGRLRSMVKCSRCRHESERYENIMDLTLEIYGWVESLEDALTQFTTPEDLDGENMYRCGRCASYVRARKQLSIDEAPNILTIVLKRFQEGSYGKINKCITFPEMLDMIPYMTRTNDIPPLYMLYGVVVHVDTLNASFSGHYVSYVKDLQSNWFRIDDSEVQPVPMSQVMSEGAYILFYMRSFPRPPRACIRNTTQEQAPVHKSSKLARRDKHNNCSSIYLDPMEDQTSMAFSRHTSNGILQKANSRFTPMMETYAEANGIEFSDATSSDWSLFTSSDEASFTSESTRDSFSTADYSDTTDPVSSVFNPFYSQEHPTQRTVSCRMFSGSKPLTRYVSEEKGFIVNSHPSAYHLDGAYQAYYPSDSNYQNFVNYGNDPEEGFLQTFSNCQL